MNHQNPRLARRSGGCRSPNRCTPIAHLPYSFCPSKDVDADYHAWIGGRERKLKGMLMRRLVATGVLLLLR